MHTLTQDKFSWIHFENGLSEEEKNNLAEKFKLNRGHLELSSHGKTPRSKMTQTKSYVYFVFHFPYILKNSKKYNICELNVFVTKNTLITIQSLGTLEPIAKFFAETNNTPQLKETRFKNGPVGLFYKLILKILEYVDNVIDIQGEEIDRSNRDIFEKKLAKHFIEHISVLRYNQTIIHSAIESQLLIFESARGTENPLKHISDKSSDGWLRIIESFYNINHEIEGDGKHLEGLIKTFESLITFRTNEVIKVLTIFSVTLLPLNVISGIYGMNFENVPLASHSAGFFITVAYMFALALSLAAVFKLKKWL